MSNQDAKRATRSELINLMRCAEGFNREDKSSLEKLVQAALAFSEVVKAAKKSTNPLQQKMLNEWYRTGGSEDG